MLRPLRRSAGLLVALFAGHLTMVAGGVVCTSTNMASMHGSTGGEMAAMTGMDAMGDAAASEHAPCSSPSQGTCVATMPCVNALGAAPPAEIAVVADASSSTVIALAVTMPVTPGSAPDLPPPRA